AQRLSASLIVSPMQLIMLEKQQERSTPFGITDRFAPQWLTCSLISVRCSTPFCITDRFASRAGSISTQQPCATRLSTSPIFSPIATFCHRSRLLCAQRLSASLIVSPTRDKSCVHSLCVLNAFRHH